MWATIIFANKIPSSFELFVVKRDLSVARVIIPRLLLMDCRVLTTAHQRACLGSPLTSPRPQNSNAHYLWKQQCNSNASVNFVFVPSLCTSFAFVQHPVESNNQHTILLCCTRGCHHATSVYFYVYILYLSLIHIWRCRRYSLCRSRWSPYH